MGWIYSFQYDKIFLNDELLWNEKVLATNFAKCIRFVIPSCMLRFLPKCMVKRLYPPVKMANQQTAHLRSHLILLSIISTVISFYLSCKLYSYLFGADPDAESKTIQSSNTEESVDQDSTRASGDDATKQTKEDVIKVDENVQIEDDLPFEDVLSNVTDELSSISEDVPLETVQDIQNNITSNVPNVITCDCPDFVAVDFVFIREFTDKNVMEVSVDNLSDYYNFRGSDNEDNLSQDLETSSTVISRPNSPSYNNNKLDFSDRIPQFVVPELFDDQ